MVMKAKSEFVDKVTDKIYLGCVMGTNDIEYLKKEQITSILSMVGKNSPELDDHFDQKVVDIEDFPMTNIIKVFKECIEFIEKSKKVYVHCWAGISRASTIVIAYLMWKTKATYYESYFFVKNRRQIISPNEGFVKQLLLFEKLLKENDYNLDKIKFNEIKWPER